jgi:hypothetical protein
METLGQSETRMLVTLACRLDLPTTLARGKLLRTATSTSFTRPRSFRIITMGDFHANEFPLSIGDHCQCYRLELPLFIPLTKWRISEHEWLVNKVGMFRHAVIIDVKEHISRVAMWCGIGI